MAAARFLHHLCRWDPESGIEVGKLRHETLPRMNSLAEKGFNFSFERFLRARADEEIIAVAIFVAVAFPYCWCRGGAIISGRVPGPGTSLFNGWPNVNRQTFSTTKQTFPISIGPVDYFVPRKVGDFVRVVAMSLQTRSRCLRPLFFPIQPILPRCVSNAIFPLSRRFINRLVLKRRTSRAYPDTIRSLGCVTFNVRPYASPGNWAYMQPGEHSLQPNLFSSTVRKHHARLLFASGATHTLASPASTLHSLSFTRFDMA